MISKLLYFESPDGTETCGPPRWWLNFVKSHGVVANTLEPFLDQRNLQLLEYSAQCHRHQAVGCRTRKYTIDFYDEKAYTWFMLKYS